MSRKRGPVVHGTIYTYKVLKCRCGPCSAANTAYQRDSVRRRASKPLPANLKHGESAYTNYKCRCDVCVLDHQANARAARAQRCAKPVPAHIKHGTKSTYSNYGCRCRPCRDASAAYQRQWREERANLLADLRRSWEGLNA